MASTRVDGYTTLSPATITSRAISYSNVIDNINPAPNTQPPLSPNPKPKFESRLQVLQQ